MVSKIPPPPPLTSAELQPVNRWLIELQNILNGEGAIDATAVTQPPGTNDTTIATTAFVQAATGASITPYNSVPNMDAVPGNAGASAQYSRGDHVHPQFILQSYLAGLVLSTAGASASFGIATGQATDSTNAHYLTLASAYTKTTTTWAVGSSNGSLDTGSIAPNTWYHVYLIERPDTGIVDIATSLSASAPTTGGNIPAAYTLSRRIGSMKTDGSSHWVAFTQLGDQFRWAIPVNDLNTNVASTAAALRTLSVPTGIKVQPLTSWQITNVSASLGQVQQLLITSPDDTDTVPSTSLLDAGIFGTNDNVNNTFIAASGAAPITWTNTSAQVRTRMGTTNNTTLIATTHGWTDRRGRDG